MPLGSESNLAFPAPVRADTSANSSPRNRYTFEQSSPPMDTLVNRRGLLCRKMFRSRVVPAGSSCRSSIQMFPIKTMAADGKTVEIEYGTLPEDGSIASFGSSTASLDKVWSPPPNQKDDLYSWMAKAHNETKKNASKDKHVVGIASAL